MQYRTTVEGQPQPGNSGFPATLDQPLNARSKFFRDLRIIVPLLLLATGSFFSGQGQTRAKPPKELLASDLPLYRISFQEGEPVPGIGAMHAIKLPFECTSDGTIFISMVQPLGVGSRPSYLADFANPMLLTSFSRAGKAYTFPFDQVSDLYDVREIDHYAAESEVVFLVRATHEDPKAKPAVSNGEETAADRKRNAEAHHFFLVVFDREGKYKRTLQMEDTFEVTQFGLFSTGMYLVYGYDRTDHSARAGHAQGRRHVSQEP
jgi:hypothetical protein